MVTTWNLSTWPTCDPPTQMLVLKGICCVLQIRAWGAIQSFQTTIFRSLREAFRKLFEPYAATKRGIWHLVLSFSSEGLPGNPERAGRS